MLPANRIQAHYAAGNLEGYMPTITLPYLHLLERNIMTTPDEIRQIRLNIGFACNDEGVDDGVIEFLCNAIFR